ERGQLRGSTSSDRVFQVSPSHRCHPVDWKGQGRTIALIYKILHVNRAGSRGCRYQFCSARRCSRGLIKKWVNEIRRRPSRFLPNQVRVLLTLAAYILFQELRDRNSTRLNS